MRAGLVLIWSLGVLAALVGLCAIVSFFQKHFESEKFDELQKQVRDRANGLAFGFVYVYFLMLFAAMELRWELPLDISSLVMLGLMMQAMILHIYAMLHNAQLPLGQKPWTSVIFYSITCFFQIMICRNRMEYLEAAKQAQEKGVDMLGVSVESATEDICLILIFSIMFFSMAAMHLIRIFWPEKE